MTKLYAQRKDVFDINKVTVVGSPTITSDGVVSGFSGSDYVKVTGLTTTQANNFEFKGSFTYNVASAQQQIFTFNGTESTRVLITNAGTVRLYCTNSSISFTTGELDLNSGDVVNIEVSLDALSSTNNVSFTVNGITKTMSKSLTISDITSLTFGGASGYQPFTEGSIDLNSFKIYVDGELVYSPTKPTYLLERRKPKVWNKGQFTVVGNPSISESGVARGFSTTSYIEFPNTNLQNANTWEVEGVVQAFSQGVADGKAWLSPASGNGIMLPVACEQGNTNVQYQLYLSSTNTSWDISADNSIKFPSGSRVKCNLKFTGTQYIYTCTNLDTGEVKQVVKNSTLKIFQSPTRLGIKRHTGPLKTNDSIDLKQFKIYTNNNLVFDGGAETYVYDASKFIVVGSPTITEYGVASGFSSVNNIELPYLMPTPAKSLNIKIKFNITDIATGERSLFGQLTNPNTGFQINIQANNALRWTASKASQGDIFSRVVPNFNLSNGDYLLEIIWDGATYKLIINGEIKDSWGSTVAVINNAVYCLGNRGNLSVPFTIGSIDLTQFSITVYGEEVFTGAEEKFYAMRGR